MAWQTGQRRHDKQHLSMQGPLLRELHQTEELPQRGLTICVDEPQMHHHSNPSWCPNCQVLTAAVLLASWATLQPAEDFLGTPGQAMASPARNTTHTPSTWHASPLHGWSF